MSPSGLLVRTGSVGISFGIWFACGLLSLLGKCLHTSFYIYAIFIFKHNNIRNVHTKIWDGGKWDEP